MTPEQIAQIEARHQRDSKKPVHLVTESDMAQYHQDRRALLDDNKRLREALVQIAAYDDTRANGRLALTGSYGMFDEPASVEIARAALNPKVSE